MQGLPKTCNAYLQRVLALAKLDQSHRDELAARGIVPVHLGNAARTVYHFSAVIDDQQVTVDAKRQAFEDELDEEFPSASAPEPAVPAVKKLKKTKRGKQ
jgi:hypothetical protein